MTLSEQLHEASKVAERLSPTVTRGEKRKINASLDKAGFGGKRRFRSVGEATSVAAGVLHKHGLEWGFNAIHAFRGDTGRRSIELARSNPDDAFSPVEITNTAMAFHWTKMDDGRFEVIAYLG